MICQYASAPRDWSRSITWHLLCHLPHLAEPLHPWPGPESWANSSGCQAAPGVPARAGRAPGSAQRGVRPGPGPPGSPQRVREGDPRFSKGHRQARGGKKPLTSRERRLGGEDLPHSASLNRLEEGVENRNNSSFFQKLK